MILQTGGVAVGDTSTRSRPALAASAKASVREITPNCSPSTSITRTDVALISRLIFNSLAMGHLQTVKKLFELCTPFTDKFDEGVHTDGTEILPVPLSRRNLKSPRPLVPTNISPERAGVAGKTPTGGAEDSLTICELKETNRYPSYLARPAFVPNQRNPSLSWQMLENADNDALPSLSVKCSNRWKRPG